MTNAGENFPAPEATLETARWLGAGWDLRIVTSLPAWHSNRISRLIKLRKRHAVDTGSVAALLEVDAASVLANGDLLVRLLETFTLSQLRADAWSPGSGVAARLSASPTMRRRVTGRSPRPAKPSKALKLKLSGASLNTVPVGPTYGESNLGPFREVD